MTPELTLTIPDALWLTSNQRLPRPVVWKRTAGIRELAATAARAANLPHMTQVHIGIAVGYPTRVRADAPNAWPSAKAAIDGIVDSGVLADDNSEIVWCHSFMRASTKCPRGVHTLRFIFTDQRLPWMGDA